MGDEKEKSIASNTILKALNKKNKDIPADEAPAQNLASQNEINNAGKPSTTPSNNDTEELLLSAPLDDTESIATRDENRLLEGSDAHSSVGGAGVIDDISIIGGDDFPDDQSHCSNKISANNIKFSKQPADSLLNVGSLNDSSLSTEPLDINTWLTAVPESPGNAAENGSQKLALENQNMRPQGPTDHVRLQSQGEIRANRGNFSGHRMQGQLHRGPWPLNWVPGAPRAPRQWHPPNMNNRPHMHQRPRGPWIGRQITPRQELRPDFHIQQRHFVPHPPTQQPAVPQMMHHRPPFTNFVNITVNNNSGTSELSPIPPMQLVQPNDQLYNNQLGQTSSSEDINITTNTTSSATTQVKQELSTTGTSNQVSETENKEIEELKRKRKLKKKRRGKDKESDGDEEDGHKGTNKIPTNSFLALLADQGTPNSAVQSSEQHSNSAAAVSNSQSTASLNATPSNNSEKFRPETVNNQPPSSSANKDGPGLLGAGPRMSIIQSIVSQNPVVPQQVGMLHRPPSIPGALPSQDMSVLHNQPVVQEPIPPPRWEDFSRQRNLKPSESNAPRGVCYHFWDKGFCPKNNACTYPHVQRNLKKNERVNDQLINPKSSSITNIQPISSQFQGHGRDLSDRSSRKRANDSVDERREGHSSRKRSLSPTENRMTSPPLPGRMKRSASCESIVSTLDAPVATKLRKRGVKKSEMDKMESFQNFIDNHNIEAARVQALQICRDFDHGSISKEFLMDHRKSFEQFMQFIVRQTREMVNVEDAHAAFLVLGLKRKLKLRPEDLESCCEIQLKVNNFNVAIDLLMELSECFDVKNRMLFQEICQNIYQGYEKVLILWPTYRQEALLNFRFVNLMLGTWDVLELKEKLVRNDIDKIGRLVMDRCKFSLGAMNNFFSIYVPSSMRKLSRMLSCVQNPSMMLQHATVQHNMFSLVKELDDLTEMKAMLDANPGVQVNINPEKWNELLCKCSSDTQFAGKIYAIARSYNVALTPVTVLQYLTALIEAGLTADFVRVVNNENLMAQQSIVMPTGLGNALLDRLDNLNNSTPCELSYTICYLLLISDRLPQEASVRIVIEMLANKRRYEQLIALLLKCFDAKLYLSQLDLRHYIRILEHWTKDPLASVGIYRRMREMYPRPEYLNEKYRPGQPTCPPTPPPNSKLPAPFVSPTSHGVQSNVSTPFSHPNQSLPSTQQLPPPGPLPNVFLNNSTFNSTQGAPFSRPSMNPESASPFSMGQANAGFISQPVGSHHSSTIDVDVNIANAANPTTSISVDLAMTSNDLTASGPATVVPMPPFPDAQTIAMYQQPNVQESSHQCISRKQIMSLKNSLWS